MKYLYSNIYSQSLLVIEKTLVQFFFPSLMIYFWGKENFNLWIFVFSIPSFFSLFQVSVSSPSRNHLSIMFKNKKFKSLNIFYQNTLFFVILNILFLILILSIYIFFNFKNPSVKNNFEIIFITIICTSITLLIGPLSAVLTYRGAIKKNNILEIFFDLLIGIAIPFSYFFLESFKSVFYVTLNIYLIKLIFFYLFIDDNLIDKNLHFKFINLKILRKILNISFGINLENIGSIIKGPGLIFLFGVSNNLNVTGLVSTVRTLFYFFPIRIFDILYNSYYLEFTKFYIANRFSNSVLKFYFKTLILVISLLIFFFIFNLFYGNLIYSFWLNDAFNSVDTNLIILILLDTILFLLINFLTLPLKSINNYTYFGFIDFIINILIFFILLKYNLFSDLIYVFKIILFFSIISFILKFILLIFFLKKELRIIDKKQ